MLLSYVFVIEIINYNFFLVLMKMNNKSKETAVLKSNSNTWLNDVEILSFIWKTNKKGFGKIYCFIELQYVKRNRWTYINNKTKNVYVAFFIDIIIQLT